LNCNLDWLQGVVGSTACLNPAGPEADEYLRQTGGADVVFECAGRAATVAGAPRLARRGGMAVILGVLPAGQKVDIEPFDLPFREVSVITSFLNPFAHARAADLIATEAIQVSPLVSRSLTLEAAVTAIASPALDGEIRALVVPALAIGA
jgi:L-iditol 2-dehydrogenase